MRRIILLGCILLLVGCSKKEEIPKETEPQYMSERVCSFSQYADTISISLEDGEFFKSITPTACEILYGDSTIDMTYIEGNSLNDFPKAVHDSLDAMDISDIKDSSFTADGKYYTFSKSDSNDYIMIRGDESNKSYIKELRSRLNVEVPKNEES